MIQTKNEALRRRSITLACHRFSVCLEQVQATTGTAHRPAISSMAANSLKSILRRFSENNHHWIASSPSLHIRKAEGCLITFFSIWRAFPLQSRRPSSEASRRSTFISEVSAPSLKVTRECNYRECTRDNSSSEGACRYRQGIDTCARTNRVQSLGRVLHDKRIETNACSGKTVTKHSQCGEFVQIFTDRIARRVKGCSRRAKDSAKSSPTAQASTRRSNTWSSTDGGRHTDEEDEQTARRRTRSLQSLPRRWRCRRKSCGWGERDERGSTCTPCLSRYSDSKPEEDVLSYGRKNMRSNSPNFVLVNIRGRVRNATHMRSTLFDNTDLFPGRSYPKFDRSSIPRL